MNFPHKIRIVEKFLQSQKIIFNEAMEVLRKMIDDDASVDEENTDITNEYNVIKTNFQTLLDKTWHDLMHSEIKLFECIETANIDFKQVIDALLNEFIEYAQAIFVQMRNSEINFSGAMHETVAKFITMKAVVAEEDTVAVELQEVCYVRITYICKSCNAIFCFQISSVSKISPTLANLFWVVVNITSYVLTHAKKALLVEVVLG